MKTTRYFCDRCKTEVGSAFNLYDVTVQRVNDNVLAVEVCATCASLVLGFVHATSNTAGLSAEDDSRTVQVPGRYEQQEPRS